MKRLRWLTVLVLLEAFFLQAEGADREIRFKHGATDAHVSGHLSNSQEVCYALIARNGQKMKLDANAKNGAITINVTSPDGNTQGEPGGSLGMDLSQTGKYRVCLTESMMGDPWSGSFTLNVAIK
ncbi:MAG: hypothetical protein WA324_27920 [Bryobacteraceae bacterium]